MTAALATLGPSLARRLVSSEDGAALLAFCLLAVLPILFSGYLIYILPQYMLHGVMAMSLALLWGRGGVLSFGQAGFYTIGGYTMGLAFHWVPLVNPAYAGMVVSFIIGGLLAAVLGYFLFSAGVRSAYFVIVTLAVSIIVRQVAVSQSQVTGGWNGMYIDRMSLTFGPWMNVSLYNDAPMYYFVLAIVAAIYVALRRLLAAKFGKVLVGIRDNEDRVLSLGFNVSYYKTAVFAIAGALSAFAGALYGTNAGFVAPALADVNFSTEVVVWVAIGGRSSLLSAFLAAIAVSLLSNYLSALIPAYWPLILGTLFVLVIIFFRGGVAGAIERWNRNRLARSAGNG
jgi:urea transport system permease protein